MLPLNSAITSAIFWPIVIFSSISSLTFRLTLWRTSLSVV